MTDPEIHEQEIADVSPTRNLNPLQFFAPGGDPAVQRDFRPSTFVFDNSEDEIEETEDGHGNMARKKPHVPTHPSQNRRRLRNRETAQQEINFDGDLVPDPSGEPQTEEEYSHPAGSEEPKQAPGITGSKPDQPVPE